MDQSTATQFSLGATFRRVTGSACHIVSLARCPGRQCQVRSTWANISGRLGLRSGATMARNAALLLLAAAFALSAEDYSALKVEALSPGFKGTEGPVWSRQGYLLFSDF